MRLVIAVTGPINYLVLIGHIDLLPALFEIVILPSVVQTESAVRRAPAAVRDWIAKPSPWVEVRETSTDFNSDPLLKGIHAGERAAITLAATLHADLLLMDDRKGVKAARGKGLRVTGTLGILELATRGGLVDFAQAVGLYSKRTSEVLTIFSLPCWKSIEKINNEALMNLRRASFA